MNHFMGVSAHVCIVVYVMMTGINDTFTPQELNTQAHAIVHIRDQHTRYSYTIILCVASALSQKQTIARRRVCENRHKNNNTFVRCTDAPTSPFVVYPLTDADKIQMIMVVNIAMRNLCDCERVFYPKRHLRQGCSMQILALQGLPGDVVYDCYVTQRVTSQSHRPDDVSWSRARWRAGMSNPR